MSGTCEGLLVLLSVWWWRHDIISTYGFDTLLSSWWVITREFTRMGNNGHQQAGIKFSVWSNQLRMKHCQYLVMTLSLSHMLRQAKTCRSFRSTPSKIPRTDSIQKTVTDSEEDSQQTSPRWWGHGFVKLQDFQRNSRILHLIKMHSF